MTQTQERIADKIRKLLAIASDDAASEAEIQNAMNFAAKMMAAHHLTEDDLSHEPDDDYKKVDKSEFGDRRSYVGRKAFHWEMVLATFVSRFVGVPVYRDNQLRIVRNRRGIAQMDEKDNPRKGKSVVFYGVDEDAAIAAELYDELRGLIASMAVIRFASVYKGDGGMYSEGFVSGLFSQLKKAKNLENNSGSTAMILVARRDDLIKYKEKAAKNWLSKSQGIRVSKRGGQTRGARGSREAFSEGKADGASTNVGATRNKKLA